MNAITTFEFTPALVLRAINIDGEPWFIAKDVCDVLELRDTNKALLALDPDEVSEHEQYSGSGRKPKLINESGLYSLILKSRKPEARTFKKWVTSVVLPSIRKTGTFTVPAQATPGPAIPHDYLAALEELIGSLESSALRA